MYIHILVSLPCFLQGEKLSSGVGPRGTDGQSAGTRAIHSVVSQETKKDDTILHDDSCKECANFCASFKNTIEFSNQTKHSMPPGNL